MARVLGNPELIQPQFHQRMMNPVISVMGGSCTPPYVPSCFVFHLRSCCVCGRIAEKCEIMKYILIYFLFLKRINILEKTLYKTY